MAIVDADGRPISVRTEEERLAALHANYAGLSDDEKAAFLALVQTLEVGDTTHYDNIVMEEYERIPVDPITFLTDDYYLGAVGANMWPRLQEDYVDLFDNGYTEALLLGSLGWGKSFFASCVLSYVIYQISCLKDPQRAYGLAPGSSIVVALISMTRDVARRVPLNELHMKLEQIPYFKEEFPFKYASSKYEISFGKRITVVAGSAMSSVIGGNVFSAFIDESSFMGNVKAVDRNGQPIVEDKGEQIYNGILRRMKSRFQKVGKLPGVLIVASSKERPVAFVERKVAEARENQDPNAFVREYCLTGDTLIPMLDGSEVTIAELSQRVGDGYAWVYSMDTSRGKIVPGRAHHFRLTKKNEPIVKVTLDDGSEIKCTGDHPFMMMNGEYVNADDLVPGDSLMPARRRVNDKGYEEIQQPWKQGKWQKTHTMVALDMYGKWGPRGGDGKPMVVHHRDFNKRNNEPGNLLVMEWTDHQVLHKSEMTSLLAYVKTDEHSRFSSENMSALHRDPGFASRRDDRGRKQFNKMWRDQGFRDAHGRRASATLSAFHRTDAGRKHQSERSLRYWRDNRKTDIGVIVVAAERGDSISDVAASLGCTSAAICQALKRNGLPRYSEIKKSSGHRSPNHSVVSVIPCGTADVYDMSVDGYENFAVSAGVFVHNCTWNVKPREFFSDDWFKIAVGNDRTRSVIDPSPEQIEWYEAQGLRTIEVPSDYRKDFESNLEGALRDIAGVATEVLSPFIHRVEKIASAVHEDLPSVTDIEEWVAGTPLDFDWNRICEGFQRRLPGGYEEQAWKPRRHPNAVRFAHIDPSLSNDSAGICIAHIARWTEVVRRDQFGEEHSELAPVVETDFILSVKPPVGDEIFLGDLRAIIYQFASHGFQIGFCSLDSYQSADTMQQLRQRGIESEVVSLDRTPEPYEMFKTALYEDRIVLHKHDKVIMELHHLQRVPHGSGYKIDHPKTSSKDTSDALAGCAYNLLTRLPGQPIAPVIGGEKQKNDDDAWVTGGKIMVQSQKSTIPGRGRVGPGPKTGNMPFMKG